MTITPDKIRERSPLYDGLSDEAAVFLFVLIDKLAAKLEVENETPEDKTKTLESLLYRGLAQIVEFDEGFTLRLTEAGEAALFGVFGDSLFTKKVGDLLN